MSDTGDYVLGIVGLLAVVISMAIAGRTTRRAALPSWTGAPAVLADAVLAIAYLVVISELLGLFGILDGVLLVVACLVVGGGAVRMEPMLMRAGARVGDHAVYFPRQNVWLVKFVFRRQFEQGGVRDAAP